MEIKNNFLKYLLALGVTILVIIFMIDVFIMPVYTRHGKEINLLDVRGKPLEEALLIIKNEGFKSIVSDTLLTNEVSEGIIVDQYPKPNVMVKKGRTVRLTVALSEKLVPIPNLVGQTLRSAEVTLNQLGLLIDTVYAEYNQKYPNGTITWQFPKMKDHLKKGMGMQLTVSKGLPPDFYQVPAVVGLSLNKAKEELAQARLEVGRITYQEDQQLVPYTVLEQSISEGTVLHKPTKIDLQVSVLDLQDIFNQKMSGPN